MGNVELENRLAILEREVARLSSMVEGSTSAAARWWERIAGTFANDPAYEAAMKLGREYRESLRPVTSKREKG